MKRINYLLISSILIIVFACDEPIVEDNPTLTITPVVSILEFPAEIINESNTFTVTTNENWWHVRVLTIDSLWCKVTINEQHNSFTIKPLKNETTSARSATVRISGISAPNIDITVRQKAQISHSTDDYEYENGTRWD